MGIERKGKCVYVCVCVCVCVYVSVCVCESEWFVSGVNRDSVVRKKLRWRGGRDFKLDRRALSSDASCHSILYYIIFYYTTIEDKCMCLYGRLKALCVLSVIDSFECSVFYYQLIAKNKGMVQR